MWCKDFTDEQLTTRLPNGKMIGWYVSETEAYMERASVRNSKINNLPACPYAKVEVKKNRVQYEFIELINGKITKEMVETVIKFAKNPDKKTMVMVITNTNDIEEDEGIKLAGKFTRRVNRKNREAKNTDEEVFCVLSNYKVDEASIEDSYVDPPQFLFFLWQHVNDIQRAIDQLDEYGYYANLDTSNFIPDDTQEDAHPILEKRKKGVCPVHKVAENVE